MGNLRDSILDEVSSIQPLDALEKQTQLDVLAWINSGVELCRLKKPATPNKHLVSYFAVVDGDYLLLVDHINAQRWLPTGGHVEPGEHPRETVLREVFEELAISGEFLFDSPILLTSTETVGKTAGHTDVSLWYVLRGSKNETLVYDKSEFNSVRWFHKDAIPFERSDPEMRRFVQKLYSLYAS
ncbi:MAG: NUDIX domain-containing protein [Leucothrix sp.]